jgi:hypothetical protein
MSAVLVGENPQNVRFTVGRHRITLLVFGRTITLPVDNRALRAYSSILPL